MTRTVCEVHAITYFRVILNLNVVLVCHFEFQLHVYLGYIRSAVLWLCYIYCTKEKKCYLLLERPLFLAFWPPRNFQADIALQC